MRLTTLPTYDLQLRLMQRRTRRRLSQRIAGALVIYWTLAIVFIEIARSVTRIDYPSVITAHAYLFGFIYIFFSQLIALGILCFHPYWMAAIVRDAESRFLRRKGLESDLISITAGGTYSYVLNRFAALYRKFLPHMIVLAFAYWGSAIIISFEYRRGFNFDVTSIFTGENIVLLQPNIYFPPIPSLFMAGVLPLITLSGLLMVYSALSLLVVAATKHIQSAVMVLLRIISAIAIAFTVQPFFLPYDNLDGLLNYAIFSFVDGGLHIATGAFGRAPISSGGIVDSAYPFYVWMSAATFWLMCALVTGILLELTVRHLRRR